ncbi:MAG TPA: methylaspartate mutase [Firmicutes bacterium]|nr:methylaspartate mutase [Bacillota bacterium]
MAQLNKDKIKSIIATDCGSTTTKAILIEEVDGVFRLIARGEAPTTVEAPFEDVTIGVRNAIRELEELVGKKFLQDSQERGVMTPRTDPKTGVDLYLSTSSAGGGLQMMVAGVVKNMTAESAERAALGAGAIVMDAIAINDGRMPHQKIQRIRQLRPDMILVSGGIDGGTISHVAELAELIAAAEPRPRLGIGYNLPIIYAGNKDARNYVKDILGSKTDLRIVDNLRPVLERELLGPARHEIHNLFMEHVMAQAPGYNKLMKWADAPIMPTPGAVGLIIENTAKQENISVVGVDIGGATTDVFSVFQETFNRTVSANLGMSYSICNVLTEAGVENILRWIPFDIDPFDLRNRIRNKMIRPTTIPQTLEDLVIEQALAREALRLAFDHHKSLAVGLRGIQQVRDISQTFEQTSTGETLVDPMELGMIIGSGGVLSHAPRRIQSVLMMLDAFQPEGVTRITVDSIFMAPQLGVLSTLHPEAANDVFQRDCLVRLGTAIAPVGEAKEGDACVTVIATLPNGQVVEKSVPYGSIDTIPLAEGHADVVIRPARSFDVGEGRGHELKAQLEGGIGGLIIDARGRQPFFLPSDTENRIRKLVEWYKALDVYPMDVLAKYVKK